MFRIEPKATLVQAEDRTDQIGLRRRRRALLPHPTASCAASTASYIVFTSRNDNEEIDEWKLGLAFFF